MASFTPAEFPDHTYYLFGKDGGKRLAEQFGAPFLGEIPLVKSISDAGDNGYPIALDEQDPMSKAFQEIAGKVAQQLSILRANQG
jgi:ATP-binding protein involved in chromosome partitioning